MTAGRVQRLFMVLSVLSGRGRPCPCGGGVRIHKIFVDRGQIDKEYKKNIEMIRSSLEEYEKRISCGLKIKIWEYNEMRSLVERYDPGLAKALDRINRKSFAALVADIGRAVIVYDQGGWYQDASYEFGDEDHFCDIHKLYSKYDAVFRKIIPQQQGRSSSSSAMTKTADAALSSLSSTPKKMCGVAPKPFCRGTTSGPCGLDHFTNRCQTADASCVGIWQQPRTTTRPHHDCSFLLCGEMISSLKSDSSCITIYKEPEKSSASAAAHRHRLVNNNFAVRNPKSPILAAAIHLMRKRLFKAIEDFDVRNKYRGNVPGECASILHDIGTGGFSDAVLAFAGHPRSYKYAGIELYRIRTGPSSLPKQLYHSSETFNASSSKHQITLHNDNSKNHTVVFSTWHGSARARAIYAHYNAPAGANLSSSAHWHNSNNHEPLFIQKHPPPPDPWLLSLSSLSSSS